MAVDDAVVGAMRMTADDHSDIRRKPACDRLDRAAEAAAAVRIVDRSGCVLSSPFVNQQNDGVDALSLQDRRFAIGSLRLVGDVQIFRCCRRKHLWRVLQSLSDESDLDAAYGADRMGGKDGDSTTCRRPRHVGGQVLKRRSLLKPYELGPAAIEFVITD